MSIFGTTHAGVRWNTWSFSTCGAIDGHHLHGAGAGADHRDALAGELVVVVPARGVEELAAEALEALDVGQRRIDEAADARDDHARA